MTLAIAGRGWVTPLGSGIDTVWQRLLDGETAQPETITNPLSERSYPVFRVPPDALAAMPAHPRLRRASAISRFAAAAGIAALQDARIEMSPAVAERTALIFAISNGGVIYTKRFYHDVVETGAQAASPLLFPETVFNAPASHLAAILCIAGASYTIVGDGAVSVLALQMAADLMNNEEFDHCLVVAAEEADWLLCDAYRNWRLLRREPPVEPFRSPPRGMILSEGAGAVLLSRSGDVTIEKIAAGTNFKHRRDAAAAVDGVFAELSEEQSAVVLGSANGTFIDAAERAAATKHCPSAAIYTPKAALGESVGGGGMWQVISAVEALRTGSVPPVPGGLEELASRRPLCPIVSGAQRAVVSCCGLNQQVAGLRLARSA